MSTAEQPETFIFRSWPKMIFLWPTTVVCLAMGLATHFAPAHHETWGGIFMFVFGVNLLVLTFDFPRTTSLTFTMAVIAVVLGLVLINQYVEIIPGIAKFFSSLDIHASPDFYYTFFAILMILFIGMYVITRFDYWILSSNELVHHQGLLGDVERFSTAGLKLNSELSDVFEYLLWGAGRIVMTPSGTHRPIILDNVPNIKKVTRNADAILEYRTVRVEHQVKGHAAPPPVEPIADDGEA